MADWKNGTFDCMSDMKNCMCGWCCGCIQIYDNAERLGENGIVCLLAACCITPLVPLFVLRQKTRELFGIEGSTMDDVLCACCCGCCVSVQIANELDARDVHSDNAIITNQPKH